jgi:hypothetical protein
LPLLALEPQPDHSRDYEAEADHAKRAMSGAAVELEVVGCAARCEDDVDVRSVGCKEKDGRRAASRRLSGVRASVSPNRLCVRLSKRLNITG